MADMSEKQSAAAVEPRPRRKIRTGVVTSDKMQKTVTVMITRRFAHPDYGKQITRTKKIKARDEHGARVGDTVRIMETRPVAKTVCWRVTEIVEMAK
jgi:small subunit ribosomal protein S17